MNRLPDITDIPEHECSELDGERTSTRRRKQSPNIKVPHKHSTVPHTGLPEISTPRPDTEKRRTTRRRNSLPGTSDEHGNQLVPFHLPLNRQRRASLPPEFGTEDSHLFASKPSSVSQAVESFDLVECSDRSNQRRHTLDIGEIPRAPQKLKPIDMGSITDRRPTTRQRRYHSQKPAHLPHLTHSGAHNTWQSTDDSFQDCIPPHFPSVPRVQTPWRPPSRGTQAQCNSDFKVRPSNLERRLSYTGAKVCEKPTFKLSKTGQVVSFKELTHLDKYFKSLDRNKNGKVDIDDISEHMKNTLTGPTKRAGAPAPDLRFPGPIVKMLQARIDDVHELMFKDMLKIVFPKATWEEVTLMAAAISPMQEEPISQAEPNSDDEDVASMWKIWTNGSENNDLNMFQFRDVLRSLGVGIDDPYELSEFYNQVDTDGSGSISMDEFKAWWLER